jgi:hypothetical protein
MEGVEFVVSRVILLNDGLMALATIPNEYFEELMKNKATADITRGRNNIRINSAV